MFLLDWYQQYLDIRQAHKVEKVCESCETLKLQLSLANEEKARLLERVMEKPIPIPERTEAPPMRNVIPKGAMPWRVRQQMLEREDREKARAMREVPKPDAVIADAEVTKKEQEEFEAEVANAERAREASSSSKS